ncbi:MAG: hypothetical protein IJ905_07470 [Fibrobacter sp.]|nr:hypothetical protein [Fibrobacter sp.]
MKFCKIFLLLLLFFIAFANAYSIQYPVRDTVYVEREMPSHIVVARGCFEKTSLLVKKLAKMKRRNSC